MADIATVLDQAQTALDDLQDAAGAAAAGGEAQQQVIEAAWNAIAAVQAAKSKAEGLAAQLNAQDKTLDAAILARSAALDSYDTASTDGDPPPLADTTATALGGSVATAASVTPAQLDAELTAAVSAVDSAIADIAGPADPLVIAQAAAVADQKAKQSAFETRLAAAEAAMSAAQGTPGALAAALSQAKVRREDAESALDDGDSEAAVVAYVDYQSARSTLATAAADADGSGLRTAWETARDQAISALADLLESEIALAAADRALAERKSEITVELASRQQDAEQAVEDAIAALAAPPGP
jgi:hypothetical protein